MIGVLAALGNGVDGSRLHAQCCGPIMKISRRYPNRIHCRIVHEGRFFFYTSFGQVGSSCSMVGVGREVISQRESYTAIIAEWLRVCRDEHLSCPRMTKGPLSKRVLDV